MTVKAEQDSELWIQRKSARLNLAKFRHDPMSPFSAMPASAWIASNDLAFAVADGFPVSPGHTLVITKREVATWFDASQEEQAAVMALVGEVKSLLERTLTSRPDGWNIGLSDDN